MSRAIEAYIPDLDKIAEASSNPEPLVLSPEEYDEVLGKNGLYRGTRLSDVGILKAMEIGLIKIWSDEGLNLLKQVQSACIDLRLGHEFWHYRQHAISRLTLGFHRDALNEVDLLDYNYKTNDDVFVFHPNGLVLALTQEGIGCSNVVVGSFDGKSSLARLGLSNHQTAGLFHAGFAGRAMMEISNTNQIDIAVPVGAYIGSMSFTLLDQPSSRPENLKSDSISKAYRQTSPFGFRRPEWDEIRDQFLNGKVKPNGSKYDLTGDVLHLSQTRGGV